jgi:hypothetical protein
LSVYVVERGASSRDLSQIRRAIVTGVKQSPRSTARTPLGTPYVPVKAGSEAVAISLAAFPATSLSDDLANNVPIDALISSQINITGTSTVPEPSSLVLLLIALPLICGGRRLRSH